MKMTRRITILLLACLCPLLVHAQWFSGEYTSEWQWDMQKETNWVNLLRLNLSAPVWKGKGSLEAATLHVARTGESIIEDWQGFSNIFADNQVASIAVLGYMHEWQNAHLFAGVRNVNEDFFVTDITSLFTNSSCGIFPTIASSYPIANYPLSGLTLYFDVERGGWTFKNSLYNGAGYNGWKRQNNPFLIKPKRDGVFNMSQLEYEHAWGHYLAGLSIHSRQFAIDEEGNMLPPQEARRKTTCAWWLYGEQPLWKSGQRSIACMAQYSENTSKRNACYRYAELGAAYRDSLNECGLSGQYARFLQGTEYTVEATWRRQVNRILAVQPSIQYVNNKNGNFVVLSARLRCNF